MDARTFGILRRCPLVKEQGRGQTADGHVPAGIEIAHPIMDDVDNQLYKRKNRPSRQLCWQMSMKHLAIVLSAVLWTHSVWAGEIVLRDLDCKLMFPEGSTVNVVDGEKFEYTCIALVNEAACNYKNLKPARLKESRLNMML